MIYYLTVQNFIFATTKIPANTTIPIVVKEKTTSKNIFSGATVEAVINEDVIINNKVVFAKYDKAEINILSAKKAGYMGIPGEIVLSGGYVFDVNGNKHRFDFGKQLIGDEKNWPKVCTVAGIFLLPLVFFLFVKGGQAEINPIPALDVKLSDGFEM